MSSRNVRDIFHHFQPRNQTEPKSTNQDEPYPTQPTPFHSAFHKQLFTQPTEELQIMEN
jgi:hypothetical protein